MQTTTQFTPRGESAMAYFKQGYNCAQAVFLAFGDLTGMETDIAARMVSSFGGGMGRMREVCGAVSGALAVLGLLNGYSDPADSAGKSRHYEDVREFAERFKTRTGSGTIICRELLDGARVNSEAGGDPEARTPTYYQKRPCGELCAIAADELDAMLRERGVIA